MAQLRYFYGTMNSSKSARALIQFHSLQEQNIPSMLVRSDLALRDDGMVRSRVGMAEKCTCLSKLQMPSVRAVVVDEVQFAKPEEIDHLAELVDAGIDVYAYGLRTDFLGNLFPGAARMFELADSIHEIESYCWCGAPAKNNALIQDGRVVKKSAANIQINGTYVPLCRKHFHEGKWKP